MRRLQLYIGTERVDLFKDESVSLTQTIQNVKDIAKVFTEFTQTFAVPASKENNKIFQHYYNFDIDFGFDARNKADARLELNDLPFKNGKIKLNSVDLKNNVAHTYHITFFGNTVNLKDVLGDDLLSSLGALDDNSQVYNYPNIRDTIQGFPTGNNNIVVPLITHTNRLIYNSGSHSTFDPEATTNNIYPHGSGTQQQNGVDWKQFKYALRVQTIIDAIETKYTIANGYGSDIVFSDDFFNDTTNKEFDDLFIWLHRKKGNVETPSFGDATWTRVTELGTETTTGDYDVMTPIANVSNGEFTINSSFGIYGNYNFDLFFNPTAGTSQIAYDVRVTETNTGTTIIQNGVSGQYPFYTNEQLADGTYTIDIRSEQLVSFAAGGIRWTADVEEQDDNQTTLDGTVSFSNAATFSTSAVFEFNITQQIPKIKIIDFLSGMFKMFNLTAFVNDLGIIVVRTLDSYYASGSQTPINIDKYLDTKTSKVNIALPFKEINFINIEVKLEEQKLENGTVVSAEAFEKDNEIFIVTDDEKIAMPVGEYLLEDGRLVVVEAEGLIADVREVSDEVPAKEEEVEETEDLEEEKKEEEKMADVADWEGMEKRIQNLEDAIASLKKEDVEMGVENGGLKSRTVKEEFTEEATQEIVEEVKEELSAVKPIKHNPEASTPQKKQVQFAKGQFNTTLDRVLSKLNK